MTRELELELKTIPDLKELTSTSVEGYSSVVAEFSTEVDLHEAMRLVREKVDLAKGDLPADAEEPRIYEFDFEDVPILQVKPVRGVRPGPPQAAGGGAAGPLGADPLGVARRPARGPRARGAGRRLPAAPALLRSDPEGRWSRPLRDENINIPRRLHRRGRAEVPGPRRRRDRRPPGRSATSWVAAPEGRPVYVRDLADVDFGFAERRSYARLDGRPVVTLRRDQADGGEHHRDGRRRARRHRRDGGGVPAHDGGQDDPPTCPATSA